jgi:CubicO group peptidase (beta-lactamase class C family)
MVLLRTPQGEFTVSYGTTLLGARSPPGADTHFRIASNTKTMTAAVIVLLAQEGKLSLDDPVSKLCPGRAQRRQHHDHRTVEYAQWSLHLPMSSCH